MITVITGILLAGKSTLASRLKEWGYRPMLEYTTRPMREGEQDKVDYYFVTDEQFDYMEENGEFAEVFHVNTVFGLWKYGARKEDIEIAAKKGNYMLICGPTQVTQLLEAKVPMLSVLLDIDLETATARAEKRGDNLEEMQRRFMKDKPYADSLKGLVDMVLDASNSPEVNARAIDTMLASKWHGKDIHAYRIGQQQVLTQQQMTEGDIHMYLEGDSGLKPYLRLFGQGMPKNPVDQVAWLLLQGAGCGFCKVCRREPCNIKDGELCTKNIADYIRRCVHEEDKEKENGK